MDLRNVPPAPEFKALWSRVARPLWNWVEPREYRLPAGYHSPSPLSGNAFASCMVPDDPEADLHTPYPFFFVVQSLLGKHDVPTCLVPKELCDALQRTRLPRDFPLDRLKVPFPAMRFLFEDGSLAFNGGSLRFLQFAFVPKGHDAEVPDDVLGPFEPHMMRKELNAPVSELFQIATFRMNGSLQSWDGRDVCSHHSLEGVRTLGEFTDAAKVPEDEVEMGHQASYLAPHSNSIPETLPLLLNLLLFMTAKPEMIEDETVIRERRIKRNKIVDGLYSPRKVGFKFKLAATANLAPGEASGRKLLPGWRCGHWKDQPYGPGHSLRREQWIEPYFYGYGDKDAGTGRDA